jgi:hypothetical protein
MHRFPRARWVGVGCPLRISLREVHFVFDGRQSFAQALLAHQLFLLPFCTLDIFGVWLISFLCITLSCHRDVFLEHTSLLGSLFTCFVIGRVHMLGYVGFLVCWELVR